MPLDLCEQSFDNSTCVITYASNTHRDHFSTDFADRPLEARIEAVTAFSADQPELFMALLSRVYDCYYQDDLVREKIGVVSGAPFPQGNEVMPGDLSLLDPVIENRDNHRFRET